jgi:hypothetical protein
MQNILLKQIKTNVKRMIQKFVIFLNIVRFILY